MIVVVARVAVQLSCHVCMWPLTVPVAVVAWSVRCARTSLTVSAAIVRNVFFVSCRRNVMLGLVFTGAQLVALTRLLPALRRLARKARRQVRYRRRVDNYLSFEGYDVVPKPSAICGNKRLRLCSESFKFWEQ